VKVSTSVTGRQSRTEQQDLAIWVAHMYHILIPTDGSELSERAVTHGVALAKAHQGKITALHLTPPFHISALDPVTVAHDAQERHLQQARVLASQHLDAVVGSFSQRSLARTASPGVRQIHAPQLATHRGKRLRIRVVRGRAPEDYYDRFFAFAAQEPPNYSSACKLQAVALAGDIVATSSAGTRWEQAHCPRSGFRKGRSMAHGRYEGRRT
jgi:Universal stress protein family